MKKRIFIIIAGILLIIGVALFSFRHVIIGHALKITISNKTNETISLNIGDIYYDILNSSVTFSNSELIFNNTFINSEKTIKLSQLKFDKIIINDISILRLIFKREVIANKFIIATPSLWFMENHNPKPFKEKPKEIISSLKKHHDILKNLIVIVNEVEITHGKVDLKSLIDKKEHNGSVEFKLLLKKINTTNKQVTDKNNILFAEEHFVKLTSFNYTLPNGDKISFDSVIFDSKHNNLITKNLNLSIVGDSAHPKTNPITASIGNILLSGINFEAIEDLDNLEFDSLAISDGYIHLNDIRTISPVKKSDTTSNKKNIFNNLHKLKLNSFVLKNINILNTEKVSDTILDLKNINFSVNNIQVDSTILTTKIPNIDFSSLVFSSGKLKILEKESGLKIKVNNFTFTEEYGIISLLNLQVSEHTNIDVNNFMADIASVNISGISAKEIMYDHSIKISLDINDPIINIDILKALNDKTKKKKLKLGKFEINEVKISNGNIHIYEDNKLDLKITNLNFNSGKIQLTDFSKIHEINYDDFILSTSMFKINLIEKDMLVAISSLNFSKNSFKLNDISTNISDADNLNTSINISQLKFEGTNIKEIINDKTIKLTSFKIIKPKITGSLVIDANPRKAKNKHQKPALDYKIILSDFEIIEGGVSLDINHKDEQIKLKTRIDAVVDNINLTNSNDTTWINKLLWRVSLSKPTIHYQDYMISCNNIKSDNVNELLAINNIEIQDNLKNELRHGVDIRKLTIESINLSGLKYGAILNKQTPIINTITIRNPTISLFIENKNKKHNKPKGQLNKETLPFDIENFEIIDLALNIDTKDSVSTSNIKLESLSLKYNMSVTNNLINGFEYFNANNIWLLDSVKNSFYDVKSISFSKQNQNIAISGINGGSISKQLKDDNYIQYTSSGLKFIGLDVTQTYPHTITIEKIDLNDFDVTIVKNKKTKTTTTSSAKNKLELPSIINSIKIGEFFSNKINFTQQTITDTTKKELILKELGFSINSITIDSSSLNKARFEFAESISIKLNENKFISKDSLYETSVNTVRYNFYDNKLTVDSLSMKPRYKSDDFFKKAVYQTGMMNIGADKIICSNIRFEKLINDGKIHIGAIDALGLNMHIFRNKMYEMNPNQYKKMPQEALLSLPQIITIDSLKTHNSYILYKQLSKKSVIPGKIFLDKVNLSIFNINNDLTVVDKTSSMIIYFNAMLLGESKTDIKMTLPILNPANNFWFSGHVDKVNFTKLNSMTQNLVGITLKKGHGEVDIPLISGNSKHSTGLIAFKYKKLKIELYDREKAQNASGLGGSMANLLLNDILIKSKNPGFLGKARKGEVYFVRNTQKSIVAYTWKSILSGIMSTMGYNNKEQRQEKKAFKKSNS